MLLSLMIIIPILGIILSCIFEYNKFLSSKVFALCSMVLVFFLSLYYLPCNSNYNNFNINNQILYEEFRLPWISNFGIEFHLGINKFSLYMILLSSIIGIISILCSWNHSRKYQLLFYINLLLVLIGTIGTLLSIDLFLFFCFWELMLIPIYFLIIFWGNPEYNKVKRISIANQFLLYTQLSSMILLFTIMIVVCNYYYHMHYLTFNYNELIKLNLSRLLQYVVMFGFLIAFIIKMPIVPFHNWLVNVHDCSPMDSSIDLSGLLIKVAIYGLLKFNIVFCKDIIQITFPIIVFFGLVTIFYGSLMAFIEPKLKKILAYISISHMGLIFIAIFCNNLLVYKGVIIQTIFSTLSISALFVLFNQIYDRTKINNINYLGGLSNSLKYISGFFLFFLLANLNFPGTVNFIGELMIFTGIFYTFPYISMILIFSFLFSLIYSLNLMNKIFYGPLRIKKFAYLIELNYLEYSIILFLMITILLLGLFPSFFYIL